MSTATVRDVVLLIAGLLLLAHETIVAPEPRLALLTLAAAMLGLPATLRLDRARSGSSSTAPSTPPPSSSSTSSGPTE